MDGHQIDSRFFYHNGAARRRMCHRGCHCQRIVKEGQCLSGVDWLGWGIGGEKTLQVLRCGASLRNSKVKYGILRCSGIYDSGIGARFSRRHCANRYGCSLTGRTSCSGRAGDRTGIHRKTSAVITTTKIHKDGDSFLLSVSQFAVILSYQDMHHLYFPVTLRSRPICTKQPVLFLLCAEKQNAALYSAQFRTQHQSLNAVSRTGWTSRS